MNGNYVENVLGSTYNANNKEHVENVLTCAWVRLLWAKEGIDARLPASTLGFRYFHFDAAVVRKHFISRFFQEKDRTRGTRSVRQSWCYQLSGSSTYDTILMIPF